MIKKPTNELMNALNKSSSIDNYFSSEEKYLIDAPLFVYLNQLVECKGLKKSQVIRDAEMNEIYGYQLFSGVRTPSRDKLIALCFGMHLSLDESQQLLKYAGFSPLYPKNKRDSIIIWGIQKKCSIQSTNEHLYDYSLDVL